VRGKGVEASGSSSASSVPPPAPEKPADRKENGRREVQ